MLKGIRYLRFSHDKQSMHSIERQDHITTHWMQYNKVEIVDTFTDEGYTARNFDRPDIKALFEFVRKNHKRIDYLVVSELTRFSREAGDAINMVKKIQSLYDVRIVSAGRGAIYDCLDHNSFFMMGLEFLLGNSENIKRTNDINGGIYTAKAVKGLWIQGGPAPFGYTKQGKEGGRRLVVNEAEARIIRYIFDAYLMQVPVYKIKERAKELGFSRTGNNAITDLLLNPIYAGFQKVKPWKDQPGGLFPLKDHQPIIDLVKWNQVQQKMKAPEKPKVAITEDFPLRGVLKCHCSKLLTGAPSKNTYGKYFNYYKCQAAGHNNISAKKAHGQLDEALKYLSLPERMAMRLKEKSEEMFEIRFQENKKILQAKKRELNQMEDQIHSVEEKWINNQLSHESYSRWFSDLTQRRQAISAEISHLGKDQEQVYLLLQNNIERLTDMQSLYNEAVLPKKQELLRKLFDNRLYYQDKVYRTFFVMPAFAHNLLILKQKQLLIVDGMEQKTGQSPVMWTSPDHNRTFEDFLSIVDSIRVA